MEKIIETILLKITPEMLPTGLLWMMFVYYGVVRPINKRLNGLSAYIKRFLVIQRERARGQQKLASQLEALCKLLGSK